MIPAPPDNALGAFAVLAALALAVIWLTETLLAFFQ
jgi:hypothetical protein